MLPKDRLYVTYFEGDLKNGLDPDLEAKQYWLEEGVPEDHILPGNAKDNFWGEFIGFRYHHGPNTSGRDGCNRSLWSMQASYLSTVWKICSQKA